MCGGILFLLGLEVCIILIMCAFLLLVVDVVGNGCVSAWGNCMTVARCDCLLILAVFLEGDSGVAVLMVVWGRFWLVLLAFV